MKLILTLVDNVLDKLFLNPLRDASQLHRLTKKLVRELIQRRYGLTAALSSYSLASLTLMV